MCKIFDEVREMGKEQGKKEGLIIGQQKGIEINRIVSIQSLMKNLNLNIEEAMKALNIPNDEYEQYRQWVH